MKNGRYFNFRDICDRNLWDTGYLVKKLQGYGILRPPLMGPHYGTVCKRMIVEPGNWRQFCAFVSRNCRVFCVLSTTTWDSENQDVFLMILEDFL